MFKVRLYSDSDYDMLCSWWAHYNMNTPTKNMLPNTTFIVEYENKPIASACLYLMNCKAGAMIENVVGIPSCTPDIRAKGVDKLFLFLEAYAKALDYTDLVIFSINDKIAQRYKDLGFTMTNTNVTTFAKKVR